MVSMFKCLTQERLEKTKNKTKKPPQNNPTFYTRSIQLVYNIRYFVFYTIKLIG